jgi:hypothetical protein
MPNQSRPITDLRKHRRLEDRRLVLIIILFIVIVGGIAIGLVYGWSLAISGVVCLIGGAALFGFLWLILSFIERLVKHE